jgi:hypothetical protein
MSPWLTLQIQTQTATDVLARTEEWMTTHPTGAVAIALVALTFMLTRCPRCLIGTRVRRTVLREPKSLAPNTSARGSTASVGLMLGMPEEHRTGSARPRRR